jgi:uncharacterized protein YukE
MSMLWELSALKILATTAENSKTLRAALADAIKEIERLQDAWQVEHTERVRMEEQKVYWMGRANALDENGDG